MPSSKGFICRHGSGSGRQFLPSHRDHSLMTLMHLRFRSPRKISRAVWASAATRALVSVCLAIACLLPTFAAQASAAGEKKIVLVAGTPSHAKGEHEFNAGTLVLKQCLDKVPGIKCEAYLNGWPKDPAAFDGANAIMLYMDGGNNHPLIKDDHLAQIKALMDRA